MKDKKDSNSKPRNSKACGGISETDARLWQAVTGDVAPLPGKTYLKGEPDAEEEAPPPPRETIIMKKELPTDKKTGKGRDLDGRTEERLRRGELALEAKLDLHGMTQDKACDALRAFILESHQRGQRCVLVVTGKGRGEEPGILRQRVPEWLDMNPMAAIVLKTCTAQRRHGGEGALYVYLRRERG